MISTKWFQGMEAESPYMQIRKSVDYESRGSGVEADIYDRFAFHLVIYEDSRPFGTGRLLFKGGRYFIDNVCVLKEFRGKKYSDLIVRMLVRKASDIGARETYASVESKYKSIFENIGFTVADTVDECNVLMVKQGDVGGHCRIEENHRQ